MLWIVSNKLKIRMSISSSKEKFYMDIKGMKLGFRKYR